MRKLASLLFVLAFCASGSFAFQSRELTKEEAISLAEAAITRNGCTDLTPLKSRASFYDQPKGDFKFAGVHELHCRAIRAWAGTVKGKPVWIIGFSVRHKYPEMNTDLEERLLLMNRDGTKMRLENRPKRVRQILNNR